VVPHPNVHDATGETAGGQTKGALVSAPRNSQQPAPVDDAPPAEQPLNDLAELDRLVGTWHVEGGAEGTTTYEWMEGCFFLLQRVDLYQFGQEITGLEVIGHDRDFGDEPSDDIKSCFYDNNGNTLRYVYEISGEWVYPGGGGYQSTMSRVESGAV